MDPPGDRDLSPELGEQPVGALHEQMSLLPKRDGASHLGVADGDMVVADSMRQVRADKNEERLR